jgi:hypothetical protein
MTIQQAIQQRIPRVRQPQWANPSAYLRLPLFADGGHGPWAELYDDLTQQDVLGERPGSQRVFLMFDTSENYEPYTGAVSVFEQHAENFAKAYSES